MIVECIIFFLNVAFQLIARACLLNPSFCAIMCGPMNSPSDANEIEYGGDGTIVSDMFSLLSLCGSYLNKESKQNSNQKCKLSNPHALVVHCCLALATIAACLKSEGKSSASIILTSSHKKQRSRLSVLAHLSSADDTVKSCLQPHCASATLALSTLISLENGGQTRSISNLYSNGRKGRGVQICPEESRHNSETAKQGRENREEKAGKKIQNRGKRGKTSEKQN